MFYLVYAKQAFMMTLMIAFITAHAPYVHAETDEKPLTFGIVPQQSASKLARLWRPILNHLEQETGLKFVFSTAKTIPIFEQRVAEGQYDIAYMNPYHYTAFHANPGYEAIAKQKNKRIKGIIVVRKDSSIKNIEELADQTLAFPAPAAFAASVLPRAHFKQQALNITPKYVSSHDSVYLSIAKGLYPAGGGVMRTFNNVDPQIRDQLKVLWTTKEYTPHAIAVHPKLEIEKRNKIQAALIKMNDTPKSMNLLKALNFKGIEMAEDAHWNDVRTLGISLLDHLIQSPR